MNFPLYFGSVLVVMVAGLLYSSRIFARSNGAQQQKPSPQPAMDRTEFIGSQVGGESVINYSYTDMPWKLMMWDVRYFFTFAWALPWVLWPVRPCDGDHFDELSFTWQNMWCVVLHAILGVLQIVFILTLPLVFLLPVWLAAMGIAVFFALNWFICLGLNGNTITFESDPKYAPALDEHAHEQWIFLNGVAVGEAWLKSNINRLALTFKRPIIGVHNRTTGIIFDVVECLVQRNFGYATSDVRAAYKIIKEKLYNPQYSKVVFILHSQGGIEGGLVLDWLLQELPHDLLSKLEVYTFGNASNHFNNPHRHIDSQQAETKNPTTLTQIPTAITEIPLTDSPVETHSMASRRRLSNGSKSSFETNGRVPTLTSISKESSASHATTYTVPASDRAIAHVEHYAHTTDFVALWGILHFVSNERASPEMPRYIGRVFRRTSPRGGHQFSQHYLNGMFPLARNDKGELTGCAERNEFMDSTVEVAKEGTEKDNVREAVEISWALIDLAGGEEDILKGEVAVHGSFHEENGKINAGKVRVKDLSRLWQYRNGRSPPSAPDSLRRMTIA